MTQLKFSNKDQLLLYLDKLSKKYSNEEIPKSDLADVDKELLDILFKEKYIATANPASKFYKQNGINIFELGTKSIVVTAMGKNHLSELRQNHKSHPLKIVINSLLIPLILWGIEILAQKWLLH